MEQTAHESHSSFLNNPAYFISTVLINDANEEPRTSDKLEGENALTGSMVSSLYKLKDLDNTGKFGLKNIRKT